MNQKTILALVAIVAIAGILVVASTIVSQASAVRKIVREKDTRSNPNTNEIRSNQESDIGGGGDPGRL
jgi:CDP-diacylglycerol pyrophosphatase